MTMNDIPEASTTWCDPDQIGAPLPETDEVEADPQTVQIPPAESFEVLRRASEEELRAQERGEQLNPLESGRAAIAIALTPLCQLEGAVMLGVSLLEAVVKRVEQVDEDAVVTYQTGFLTTTTSPPPTFLSFLSSGYVVTWLTRLSSPPWGRRPSNNCAAACRRSSQPSVMTSPSSPAMSTLTSTPSGSLTAARRSVSLWPPMLRPSAGSAPRSMSPTSLPASTWLASPTSSVPC